MQLIELHGVDAQLYVNGLLDEERLVALVGCELQTDAFHLVERLPSELLDEEFRVGLYLAHQTNAPSVALCHEVGKVEVVVAVVHEVGLEAGLHHLQRVDGYEGQVGRQLVAALPLLDRLAEGHGTVGRIIVYFRRVSLPNRISLRAVLFRCVFRHLMLRIHGFSHLALYHVSAAVVVVVHNYYVVNGHRNLEAVFILYEHDVLSLEARNASASYLAEESHFVAYLHFFLYY